MPVQSGNAGKHLFAMIASRTIGDFSSLEQHRIIYEALVDLSLHEVGHTLGLSHNFYASHLQQTIFTIGTLQSQ